MIKAKNRPAVPCVEFDRVTNGYDPGGSPLKLSFGLPCPATAPVAWGFRGIHNAKGFDLLWDRQSWHPDTMSVSKFSKFLDAKVIKHLRRYAAELSGRDASFHHFKITYKDGPCWAVLSPLGSYGYIYGVVYTGPQ